MLLMTTRLNFLARNADRPRCGPTEGSDTARVDDSLPLYRFGVLVRSVGSEVPFIGARARCARELRNQNPTTAITSRAAKTSRTEKPSRTIDFRCPLEPKIRPCPRSQVPRQMVEFLVSGLQKQNVPPRRAARERHSIGVPSTVNTAVVPESRRKSGFYCFKDRRCGRGSPDSCA